MLQEYLGVGVVDVGKKIAPQGVMPAVHTLVRARRSKEWSVQRDSLNNLAALQLARIFEDARRFTQTMLQPAPFVEFLNGGSTDGASLKDAGSQEVPATGPASPSTTSTQRTAHPTEVTYGFSAISATIRAVEDVLWMNRSASNPTTSGPIG
jgi:hypothetical protein